jgi:urease accessory protein
MTNLKTLAGMADVVKFIETRGMLKKSAPAVS